MDMKVMAIVTGALVTMLNALDSKKIIDTI